MSESTLVNSIVGSGTFFKGQIDVSGLLRIDGDFSGSVKTAGRVIIGRGGRADCTIDAATVVIGGVFRGTVYATEKVIALETALIIGNIFAPRLIAESGVAIDGSMHIRGLTDEKAGDAERKKGSGETIPRAGGPRRRAGKRRIPLGSL
ncbi:MAG: polymer-forming cytoskeletal protein [Spirochaetaceae bacterium]|nr:MAG: polymer-forming cytoskeletal protein [Spirochaetaceae bacterium]